MSGTRGRRRRRTDSHGGTFASLRRVSLAPARVLRGMGRRRTAAAAMILALLATAGPVITPADAERVAPAHLKVTPGVESLKLSWGVTSTKDLVAFEVRWHLLAHPHQDSGKVELGTTTRSYRITNLLPKRYEIIVQAFVRVKGGHNASDDRRAATASRATSQAASTSKRKPAGTVTAVAKPLSGSEEREEKEHREEEHKKEEERREEKERREEERQHREEEQKQREEEKRREEEQSNPNCTQYASPSGNDGNSGSQGSPLRTVAHLLEKLQAGQTGCLQPGSYSSFEARSTNTHGHEGSPVTITSSNPANPATISGRVVTFPGANWLTFSHLTFTDSETLEPSITIGSAHTSWVGDDVSAPETICISPIGPGQYGPAEDTLIERDRIHNCGQPFHCEESSPPCNQPPLDGYFIHGVYDLGIKTTVRNSYLYDNELQGSTPAWGKRRGDRTQRDRRQRLGCHIRRTRTRTRHARLEHHHQQRRTVRLVQGLLRHLVVWKRRGGNVAEHNDVFGNSSGNIGPSTGVTVRNNIEVNPDYVNAAKHEYELQPGSPAAGYGPE